MEVRVTVAHTARPVFPISELHAFFMVQKVQLALVVVVPGYDVGGDGRKIFALFFEDCSVEGKIIKVPIRSKRVLGDATTS